MDLKGLSSSKIGSLLPGVFESKLASAYKKNGKQVGLCVFYRRLNPAGCIERRS